MISVGQAATELSLASSNISLSAGMWLLQCGNEVNQADEVRTWRLIHVHNIRLLQRRSANIKTSIGTQCVKIRVRWSSNTVTTYSWFWVRLIWLTTQLPVGQSGVEFSGCRTKKKTEEKAAPCKLVYWHFPQIGTVPRASARACQVRLSILHHVPEKVSQDVFVISSRNVGWFW